MERAFERCRPQKEGLSVYRSIDRAARRRSEKSEWIHRLVMMWLSRGYFNTFKLIEIPAKTEFKYSIREDNFNERVWRHNGGL